MSMGAEVSGVWMAVRSVSGESVSGGSAFRSETD